MTIRLSLMVLVALCCLVACWPVSGARTKSQVVPDVASTAFSETVHGERTCYNKRVRDPNKHISTRLTRYFVFGGILQAIAEQAQLPREELVQGGASQFQDQSSGLGRKFHAAHVIRVGAIDARLKQKKPALNAALQNYIGHTQNVIDLANFWHGVAGQIDRFQSDSLSELAKIDFGGQFDGQTRKVEDLMKLFRDIIDGHVTGAGSGGRKREEQSELEADRIGLYCAGAAMLFEAGQQGYQMVKDGTFEKHYKNA